MKRILISLFCLILILSLCTCQKKQYSDEPTADALAERALSALDAPEGYIVAEHDLLEGYFHRPDYAADFTVRIRADRNNIDEFGIFHAKDGDPAELGRMLGQYLSTSLADNRDWYDSYIPEETPKLRNAEVRVLGNYVVYAILSDGDRDRFFETVENALSL